MEDLYASIIIIFLGYVQTGTQVQTLIDRLTLKKVSYTLDIVLGFNGPLDGGGLNTYCIYNRIERQLAACCNV